MSASIRSVAAAAGVSKSTASLALRNHPSVAPDTRARVLAAARKLDYRVNPLVSALMTQQRTGHAAEGAPTLAVVDLYGAPPDPGPQRPAVNLPASARRHLAESHSAARLAARKFGYSVDILLARDAGMTPERLRGILLSRGVRGVILLMPPAPETPPAWEKFDWSGLCVVHLGSPNSPFHHVRPNIVSSVELVWRELRRRGYQRPALCIPESNERYAGYRWQMAFRQHIVATHGRPPYDFVAPAGIYETPRKLLAWLRREKIDVLCFAGPGELPQVRAAGLQVPEDVGYVALHLLPEEFGKAAGLDLRYPARFHAAVQLLDSLLRHNETGVPEVPLAVTVPGLWLEGPTVRAPGQD